MRTSSVLLLLVLGMQFSFSQTKERFAGLHLDFHATMKDSGIGKYFTPELIDSFLQITKPDFIQVDCKGHDGVSSYPTKVGNPAPAFAKDILKIWREVTSKHKIPLFMHYSGLWDTRAVTLNPHWGRVNADGKRDKNITSMFAGYTDSLLIPQMVELATEYKLDGIWIDGDCWVLGPDYHPEAKKAFLKVYGDVAVPEKPGDPLYFKWMEFHRQTFRNYITRYAKAAHKAAPLFKVTSNWSFSSMMPERVDIPVDYLSGDVAGTNSLYSSAFESRCLALQDKPWDLMAWSFAWKNNSKATKSVVQLQQEAAEVLAQGGGFQTYWQQNRDGSPEPYQFRKMAEIIKFCKDREAYTFNGVSVPQIGLLYSTYAWRRFETPSLYTAHHQEGIKGILNLLLDNQLPVDILMDHQLTERMEKYSLLVIPEWPTIDPEIKNRLLQYVENGGKLLVIGADAVGGFVNELGVRTVDTVSRNTGLFAGLRNNITLTHTSFQPFAAQGSTITIGKQMEADDLRFATANALASIASYGKGKIAGIYLNMGDFYNKNQNPFSLDLLKTVVQQLSADIVCEIKASEKVHQAVTKKNGKTYIHLINSNGPHNNPNVLVYENVTPVKNLLLEIRHAGKPSSVKLQPGNKPLTFQYKNGKIITTIAQLDIYEIIEIE